jgi:very-short-patch-repair endonuclease
MSFINDVSLKERRRELRKVPTRAERILWNALRNFRTPNKFRRQISLGPYIVDFYAASARLVIEVDGEIHSEISQQHYDADRENFLIHHGCFVLHFSNEQIYNNIHAVIKKILKMCEQHRLYPPPRLRRG